MQQPNRSAGRRSRVSVWGTVMVLGAVVAGCVPMASDISSVDSPPSVTAPDSATAAPSLSAGPITEPSRASDSPTPTPAQTPKQTPTATGELRTSGSVVSGRSGSVSWRIHVPTFSGAPAAAEVDKRVRAAMNDLIGQAKLKGRHDDGVRRRLEGEGKVVTNDGRTAQVTITYTDYLEGTAHPSNYVTTTVVDVARKRPIVLEQVFSDPTAAYETLRPAILQAAAEQASGIDQSGLAPKKSNWANWQTNQTGMVFVFDDYQLGTYGLRQYTVPWSTVQPMLTRYAERVLAPQ